jgi:hypothetical protein
MVHIHECSAWAAHLRGSGGPVGCFQDGGRHLNWCQHLSSCLPAVDDSKLAKVPTTCHLHHSRHVGGQPFGWRKQHRHLFSMKSHLARLYLAIISATSFPVERFSSVTGQVDAARTAFLSPDTLTLIVFMHETLPLVRKIRADRIVKEAHF